MTGADAAGRRTFIACQMLMVLFLVAGAAELLA